MANNIFCPKSIFDIFTEAELTAAARSINKEGLSDTGRAAIVGVREAYENFAAELAGMMEKRDRPENDPFTDRMATALVVLNVMDRAVRDKNKGTM